jgi:hypothetical protein
MLHSRDEGFGERKGTSRISMTRAKRSLLGVRARKHVGSHLSRLVDGRV